MHKRVIAQFFTVKLPFLTLVFTIFVLTMVSVCGSVGKVIRIEDFTFTVLSEEDKQGTMSVEKYLDVADLLRVPQIVVVDGITYTVTEVADWGFEQMTGVRTVVLPDTIEAVGYRAFAGCASLEEINVPESMQQIGNGAFADCVKLKNISIPATVTVIGSDAFYNCRSLEVIDVEEDNPNYASECGVLYDKQKTRLIRYPAGKGGSFDAPKTLLTVGIYAFLNASKLEEVHFPESLKTIENYAFQNCSSLRAIYFKADAPTLGHSVFSETDVTVYRLEGFEGWTNPWGGRPVVIYGGIPTLKFVRNGDGTFTILYAGVLEKSADFIHWQKVTDAVSGRYVVTPFDAKCYFRAKI